MIELWIEQWHPISDFELGAGVVLGFGGCSDEEGEKIE